jgi:hypothetical protein
MIFICDHFTGITCSCFCVLHRKLSATRCQEPHTVIFQMLEMMLKQPGLASVALSQSIGPRFRFVRRQAARPPWQVANGMVPEASLARLLLSSDKTLLRLPYYRWALAEGALVDTLALTSQARVLLKGTAAPTTIAALPLKQFDIVCPGFTEWAQRRRLADF